MSEPDPWADPATETQPGAPYAGPPRTAPPGPGWPGYPPGPYGSGPYAGGPQGWAAPPYGWAPPPLPPRRPGQVVAAAVLAFVQAGVVALASVYVFFIASIAGTVGDEVPGADYAELHRLSVEGTALAAVQLATIVALVAGGVLALGRRQPSSRWWLVGALASQVVLALYWGVRLGMLSGDLSGGGSSPAGVFAILSLFFAAGPIVGIALALVGPAGAWFAGPRNGAGASPASPLW